MKKIIAVIIIIGFILNKANAQVDVKKRLGRPELPTLKIGDQVPDFEIPKLVNSIKKSIRMSDFKDQLLIVDFWNRACSGCIAALPKMEKLEHQFSPKLTVLPTDWETEADVAPFWKNNRYTKNLTIPTVVEDKLLLSYFPFKSVPHEVWIYKGKVIAITGADYVNAENIEKVLSGASIDWPVKNDFYVFRGDKEPVFKLDSNQIGSKTFVKYAAISDYKKDAGINFVGALLNGVVKDPVKKTIRAFEVNRSIYDIYNIHWIAVMGFENFQKLKRPFQGAANETVWEVADKSRYICPKKITETEWMMRNGLCFESLNPDTGQTEQQISQSVITDLNNLLGLNVRWEKRKEKVLILVRTSKEDQLKSKKDLNAEGNFNYLDKGNMRLFRDAYLQFFIGKLNQEETNPYIFDETGYTGRVDMDLNIPSWTDITAVRKAIAPYGLTLKEEERLVDKFVFSEVNGGLMVDVEMQKAAKAKREAQKGMKAPTPDEGKAFMAANKQKTDVVTLPSGVQYKIIEKGTGVKPGINDKIISHQTAMLVNGLIFYNTKEDGRPGDPMGLDGEWERVKGLQEALKLMPVGSKWEIYLPAELAYGGASANGQIPANSAVIYQVELLGIEK